MTEWKEYTGNEEHMKFVWDADMLNHIASSKTNWTPYTPEKWKELNK